MTNSFNRYSYVWNNPLKYTDPTGFFTHENGGKSYNERVSDANKTKKQHSGSDNKNHPDNDDSEPKAGSGEIRTAQEIADLGLDDGRVVNSIDSFIDNFFSVTDNYNNYQETAQSVLDADLKTKMKAFAGVSLEMSVTAFVGKFKVLNPIADAVTKYRGGAHRDMTKPVGDGLDSHHLPARQSNPSVHPNDGPAIQVDPHDHHLTSSNGRNGLAGAIYRSEVADMINSGNMRGAMAKEIRDVRRASLEGSGSRTKYNQAMGQMLDYSKSQGMLNK